MLEAKGVDTAALKTGEVAEPAKVKLPKSSIVGKSASEFKKDQAPPTIPKSAKILVDEPKGKDTLEPKGKIDKTDLTPREPKGKDTIEPRKIDKTDLTPREPKHRSNPEPRFKAPDNNNKRMSEPPAKSKSDSNDKGEGKSGKKDRKKDSSNN
jgi:hypothetical protein